MRPRLERGLLALVIACLGTANAGAAPPVDVQTVRVGFSNNEKTNLFKVGAWTPVWVQLGAGANGFEGILEVVAPDDGGTPVAFHERVQILPKESKRIVTYARPGDRNPEFTVRVLDNGGRRAANDYNTSSTGAVLNAVQPDGTMLITLGKTAGVELLPGLSAFNVDKTQGASELVVASIDSMTGTLPGRWYGYDAATAVVLDTSDRDVMSALGAFRGPALADWVRRGGHLVVAVGRDWQAVRDSFLGAMLPAWPTDQVKVSSLEALDVYAGTGANKQTKQITPPGSPPVMITKLEDVEKRGGKVLAATGDLPLVVRGSFGFGQVTMVGLDVDQKPFATWEDRPMFWVRTIDLRRRSGENANANMPGMGGGRMYQANESDLAGTLRRALEQFPGVQLVPFGWVAFFIFVYILLIGPGDYLFLKKVVKRMELTWITFPVIVVTVSLLAYYAAYVVKGSELRVNKVDVVDVDEAAGILRGSSWINIFSPQNRDYDVAVIPRSLDVHDPNDDPKAAPRPPVGTEVVVSWFNAPEPGFGGMGGQSRLSFSNNGYSYSPVGAAESLESVRVPIWSTKCLTARWFGQTNSLVESKLRPVGLNQIEGTITNHTPFPLDDAVLVFGRQIYTLKSIAPGATVRINAGETRFLSGRLKEDQASYSTGNRYDTSSNVNRSNLLFAMMFHDSLGSAASGESLLTNMPLHYLDLSGQVTLGRPMLVAKMKRSGARLVLAHAPSPPKIDETTLLRVILPLEAAAAPPAKPAKDKADEKEGR